MFYNVGLNCIRLNPQKCLRNYSLVYKLCCKVEYVSPISSCLAYSSCSKLHTIYNLPHTDALISKSFRVKLLQSSFSSNFEIIRSKSSGKKKKGQRTEDSDSDSDDEEEEEWMLEKGKNFKDAVIKIPSLRIDAIAKVGFGISRNKASECFYGGKFKLNKAKAPKISASVSPGDVLDYFQSSSSSSESENISRVKILKIGEYDSKSDRFTLLIRRFPKLTSEEYEKNLEES